MGANIHEGAGANSPGRSITFLVQEYCGCGSLQKLMEKQMDKGSLKLKEYTVMDALEWLIDIASGLKYLHEASPSIIHRDLKLGEQRLPASLAPKQDCARQHVDKRLRCPSALPAPIHSPSAFVSIGCPGTDKTEVSLDRKCVDAVLQRQDACEAGRFRPLGSDHQKTPDAENAPIDLCGELEQAEHLRFVTETGGRSAPFDYTTRREDVAENLVRQKHRSVP